MTRGLGLGMLLFALAAVGAQEGVPDEAKKHAKDFTQNYGEWVLQKNGKYPYYRSIYTAKDKAGNVASEQWIWYLPDAPRAGEPDDWSHYWVYWYNPKQETIWARCPSPHHPKYLEWRKSEGRDLWQVIPEVKRLKGEMSITKVGKLFGATFSSKKTGLPLVTKTSKEVITCVDFEQSVFN